MITHKKDNVVVTECNIKLTDCNWSDYWEDVSCDECNEIAPHECPNCGYEFLPEDSECQECEWDKE